MRGVSESTGLIRDPENDDQGMSYSTIGNGKIRSTFDEMVQKSTFIHIGNEGGAEFKTFDFRTLANWPSGSFAHSLRNMWKGYKTKEELEKNPKPLQEFYREQNDLLEEYLQCSVGHDILEEEEKSFVHRCAEALELNSDDDDNSESKKVRRAVYLSNACNILLLFAQAFAFINSMSLALLATLTDATLDFVSGLLVLLTWKLKNSRDKYSYPVGQSRLEPLGVIGMACLMTSATLITLQESTTTLIGGQDSAKFSGLSPLVVGLLILALLTKLCLYLLCKGSSDMSVRSLAVDHLNDVIANSVSITTVFLAERYLWWLDPAGGICISVLIIVNWVRHTLEHVQNLLGKVADGKTLSIVTFLACNHHPRILKVDTVRAYHVGNGLFVECDIVLSSDMLLWEAHDIGESLQNRIEMFSGVDRAFVHLDTEAEHSPDIEHKII
uniref:Cation efflux protein cytoplasmic domain-containing protein n=1 Tax=Rhodosorus marinus TaxID=101924 RepID=A0A7S0BQB0_9RHOD|mmetsp:Transcript_25329/g.36463  ORF Transcript_25329/g.36463 Transcript_25329/m.36463 type:complete len:441 (+) Transcript_25329:182-1504(+)